MEGPRSSCVVKKGTLVKRRQGGPIEKIPAEVLSEIFLALRDAWCPVHLEDLLSSDYVFFFFFIKWMNRWSPIMFVNKTWNSVALSCPRLWSHIDISWRHYQTFVSRAKHTALALFCSVPPLLLREDPDMLSRIKSLYVVCDMNPWTEALDELPSLPKLEYLHLELGLHVAVSGAPPQPPELFITGEFPSLKSVAIDGYDFDWSHSIFSSNLRKLRVSCRVHDGSSPLLSLADTLNAVRRMPLLEELYLDGLYEHGQPAGGTFFEAVTLAHLRYLSITGHLCPCYRLLRALRLPGSTSLDMMVEDARHWQEDPTGALFDTLRRMLVGQWTIGDPSQIKHMLAEDREIPDSNARVIHLHCLDENPYADADEKTVSRHLDSTGHCCSFGTGQNDVTKSPRRLRHWDRSRWELRVRIGFLVGAEDHQRLNPEWVKLLCKDWPLQGVESLSLGLGPFGTFHVQSLFPNVTTLALALENDKGVFTGKRLGGMLCRFPSAEAARAHAQSGEASCERAVKLPHFPKLETLVVEVAELKHWQRKHFQGEEPDLVALYLRNLKARDALTFRKLHLVWYSYAPHRVRETADALERLKQAFPKLTIVPDQLPFASESRKTTRPSHSCHEIAAAAAMVGLMI